MRQQPLPFNGSKYGTKIKGKDRHEERFSLGYPPKKLTGPLQKHLRKVYRQNKVECERQLQILGISLKEFERKIGVSL